MTTPRDRSAKIVARSLYRELTSGGFGPTQIVNVASELIELVAADANRLNEAKEDPSGRPLILGQRRRVDARVHELFDKRDLRGAAEHITENYGPEILSWLLGVLADEALARRAYTRFRGGIVDGIEQLDIYEPLRCWVYRLALVAASEYLPEAPSVSSDPVAPCDPSRAIDELRARLSADDRMLLLLHIDREMTWNEVARIVGRNADDLEQHFERIRERLRQLAAETGLIDEAA